MCDVTKGTNASSRCANIFSTANAALIFSPSRRFGGGGEAPVFAGSLITTVFKGRCKQRAHKNVTVFLFH